MSLKVCTIINNPVPSNCHVLYDADVKSCLLIDPGSSNGTIIDDELSGLGLIPEGIILTHEHFDHVWSCRYFVEKYNIPIICSRECSESIIDMKKNHSVFYDNTNAFVCPKASYILDDNHWKMKWHDKALDFHFAGGHTASGVFVMVENLLFTGDTLLKDLKTVTKLRCGSKVQLSESIEYLKSLQGQAYRVYAGHGSDFLLDDYDLSIALG